MYLELAKTSILKMSQVVITFTVKISFFLIGNYLPVCSEFIINNDKLTLKKGDVCTYVRTLQGVATVLTPLYNIRIVSKIRSSYIQFGINYFRLILKVI